MAATAALVAIAALAATAALAAALAAAKADGVTALLTAGDVDATLAGAEGLATGKAAVAAEAVGTGGLTAAGAGTGTVITDAEAAPRALLAAVEEAMPSLFKSLIFFDNSATRDADSLACRVEAICCSAEVADFAVVAPLESVSLSGTALAGARSSTFASTLPLAWRSALATVVVEIPLANLRRNALKSALCATIVWLACSAVTAVTVS